MVKRGRVEVGLTPSEVSGARSTSIKRGCAVSGDEKPGLYDAELRRISDKLVTQQVPE